MISISKTHRLQNGRYSIEAELYEGQIDRTYKAIDLEQNRLVAIKTFKLELLKENFFSSNLTIMPSKQSKKFIKCQHPNIVKFENFFIEDKLPYIVTDYIVGKTLDKIVTPDNPLPENTAIAYIHQIAKGLEILHQKRLLHRNIKPRNLILSENTGAVILIDLALIDYCTLREFEQQGFIKIQAKSISNEGYSAIEQYIPQAEQSFATDVYSLAATLYTLVTGYVPTSSVLRSRMPILTPQEFCPSLSDRTCQAIMQGMALEAKDRPSSVAKWLALLTDVDRSLNPPQHNPPSKDVLVNSEIDRNLAKVYNNRGLVYRKQEKWSLAIKYYSKAIISDPNYAKAYNNRGVVYSMLEQWDLALADYDRAIQIDHYRANFYYNRGNVHFYQQKWELAIANYSKAIDLDRDYGAAYYNRGQVWRKLNHQQKAILDLKTAAELFKQQDNLAAYQESINAYNCLNVNN